PDGRCLASGGDDGPVRSWDTAKGAVDQVIASLRGGGFIVWDATGNLARCSQDAWEHLAWLAPADADHPYGRSLPAEYFGPLPVVSSRP
ncbi:MAG: hypothetical protein LBO20_08445, partial [Bifidobacteriaceae bacterium]|nr:hypothetical protein [Bifidobacteriaceae bacterium]